MRSVRNLAISLHMLPNCAFLRLWSHDTLAHWLMLHLWSHGSVRLKNLALARPRVFFARPPVQYLLSRRNLHIVQHCISCNLPTLLDRPPIDRARFALSPQRQPVHRETATASLTTEHRLCKDRNVGNQRTATRIWEHTFTLRTAVGIMQRKHRHLTTQTTFGNVRCRVRLKRQRS